MFLFTIHVMIFFHIWIHPIYIYRLTVKIAISQVLCTFRIMKCFELSWIIMIFLKMTCSISLISEILPA